MTGFTASVHDEAVSCERRDARSRATFMQLAASTDFRDADLDAIVELNILRAVGPSPRLLQLERQLAARFSMQCRLAVYGSLAPGRSNHGQLRSLRGDWHSGCSVRGELVDRGWGASLGYPALRWASSGPVVSIELFVSDDLPRHWARLDEFEGVDYLRIVVPVHSGTSVVTVANLYAAREPGTSPERERGGRAAA